MNAAHLHLIINHFPVVGTFMAFLVLLLGWLGKKPALQKTALILFVFVGLISIPVYVSGNGAEDIVEKFPGISHEAIEAHEDSAVVTLIFIEILAVTALMGFALFGRREVLPGGFLLTVVVLTIVAGVLTANTSNLGGKIHHSQEMGGTLPSGEEPESEEKE
ncbi:MAG: hypothetical protein L0Z48_03415 [candidate division Zixibacteria bacterium]|nr:hypothetical protein [candidate division Zixibacteria bacterium]MCI0595574.1 hypothetical protein [candidate division Zixibacteria bacterium]